MAPPLYAHDLTDVALGSLSTENWDESSDAGYDDGGSMVDDGNLYYNGNSCVSAQFTKDGVGTIINADAGGITIPTDGAALIHGLWAAPPALASYALGGVRALIGTSYGDFKVYYASGSDRAPAPIGGWNQYAIDPAQTEDAVVGSPGTAYTHIGIAISATAQARGNPNAVNAIRYGRCQVTFTEGEVADPAKYFDFALTDNLPVNKLGLLQQLESGYKQRGLQSFGTDAIPVYFKDSGVAILLADTPNVSSDFHRWEVRHDNSVVEWEAFSIKALGLNAKGNFEVIADTAEVNHKVCTFENLGTFKYGSGSTLTTTTHRNCEPVSQFGATMIGGVIDKPINTIGVYVTDIGILSKYTFNSKGTGHAVDLGTITADITKNWDNIDIDYAVSDGSTGNETILVSVDNGVTLTINVASGATTPTIYNTGTGTVTVVTNQVTLTLTGLVVGSDVVILESGTQTVLASVDQGGATFDYTYSIVQDVDIGIIKPGYVTLYTFGYTLPSSDGSYPISQIVDRNYPV